MIDGVYDAVGDDFTEDEVVSAIRHCNYDSKKAISHLLYGPSSTTPSKNSKKATNSNNNNNNTKNNKNNKPSTPSSKGGTNSTQTTPSKTGNTVVLVTPQTNPTTKTAFLNPSPSDLAKDLCTPHIAVMPQLKNSSAVDPNSGSFFVNAQRKSFLQIADIVPFSFAEPSPDDIVKGKQKMAFSKKPDKPRKEETGDTTDDVNANAINDQASEQQVAESNIGYLFTLIAGNSPRRSN